MGAGAAEAPISVAEAEPTVAEMESFEGLDAAFLEAVDSLQLGIDLVVEDGIQPCMKEQGFDYVPASRESVATRLGMGPSGEPFGLVDQFSVAAWALHQHFDSGASGHDLDSETRNAKVLDSLSGQERDEWERVRLDCLVEISNANPNPLASETNWFGLATEEAATRTAAAPDVTAAEVEFDRCFDAHGFGTVEQASGNAYNESEAVVQRFHAGDLGEKAARAELEALVAIEQEMAAAFEACDGPRREVVSRVYGEEFQKVVERDGDKAVIWVAEFQDKIERYVARLDEH